jgi:hypothetical protein
VHLPSIETTFSLHQKVVFDVKSLEKINNLKKEIHIYKARSLHNSSSVERMAVVHLVGWPKIRKIQKIFEGRSLIIPEKVTGDFMAKYIETIVELYPSDNYVINDVDMKVINLLYKKYTETIGHNSVMDYMKMTIKSFKTHHKDLQSALRRSLLSEYN